MSSIKNILCEPFQTLLLPDKDKNISIVFVKYFHISHFLNSTKRGQFLSHFSLCVDVFAGGGSQRGLLEGVARGGGWRGWLEGVAEGGG